MALPKLKTVTRTQGANRAFKEARAVFEEIGI